MADRKGRPTVRMKVTITGYYDAPLDPEVYEGTTDPQRMAAIDAENGVDAVYDLLTDFSMTIEPQAGT